MNILTIDTVLNKTYIALFKNNREIFKTLETDEKNYHSVYLIKALKDLNALEGLEYIGVNTGVGSFTGIRVGLSVAKVIACQLDIKAIGFETIEVLASAYKNNNILLDAKRGCVFYSDDGKNIQMIEYQHALDIVQKSNHNFICDESIYKKFNLKKLLPFENGPDLAKTELEIVKERIKNNEITDYNGLKPTYIQTAPIFCK